MRRLALIGAAALGVLALAAYFALPLLFPPQRLSALMSEQVRAATGRDLRIGGKLSFRLLPSIAVVAHDVHFGNAAWGTRPQMASVGKAAFQVALRPLLSGQLHILSIEVDDADALLETDGQGHYNWIFERPDTPPAASTATQPITLDRLLLRNTRIAFHDGHTGTTQSVLIESLTLSNPRDQLHLEAVLTSTGRRWQLKATTGRYEALAAGAGDWPFDATLNTDGATLSATGAVTPGQPSATLRADLAARLDKADVLAPLWAHAAQLPLPIEAKLSLLRSARTVQATGLRIAAAGQVVEGKATVHTRERPLRIEAQLAAHALDVAALLRNVSAGKKPAADTSAAQGPLFNDDPLPRIALPPLPIELALTVDRLLLPGRTAPVKLSTRIQSRPERLVLEPLTLGIGDGTVHARLDLALRGHEAPRWAAHVDTKGVALDALRDLAGTSGRLRGGRSTIDAQFTVAGHTPRQLAASTSGTLMLAVSDSAFGGAGAAGSNVIVALLEALLPRRGSPQDTLPIECVVVRLPFVRGVAQIDRSIGLETRQLAIAASGELNLAAQTVDLHFHTLVKKGIGLSTANFAQLVQLRGPLHDPSMSLDLAGTAGEAASIGAAVATAGLSMVARRVLRSGDDTRACQRAAKTTAAKTR